MMYKIKIDDIVCEGAVTIKNSCNTISNCELKIKASKEINSALFFYIQDNIEKVKSNLIQGLFRSLFHVNIDDYRLIARTFDFETSDSSFSIYFEGVLQI